MRIYKLIFLSLSKDTIIICLPRPTSALLTAHLEQHAFSSWIWYRQLSDGHAFLLQLSFPSCDERTSIAILIFKIIIRWSLSNKRCIHFAILTLHLHVTQFISPYGRTLGCQTAPFSYTAPRTLHPPAISTSSSVRICGRSLSLLCSTTSSGLGGGGSLHIYWKGSHIYSK